ncbi:MULTISPECIES: Gfo/Idh/MocA family protein [Clostridium]|uniref:1,5-anhydro-D-fructose reductase n=1 Tax=Clostridium colicanis DSM 13634 TaxID=1121305 RepID=A0A151ARU5_9CLOT|nr:MULTISPECIES: Gfo/Idh/MocA family oxidoreductase [Clostridium]KYH30303.1 1,5-anhydro-D-fructose reductase [Clostridium colicanis DSM 13634]MBE6044474.1 Gfo/Idh/MocA family oxidoreductase [Clostridium thermopalmarium]
MRKKIRWGIMGTGTIAHSFAEGLSNVLDGELYAVASRSKEKAEQFGKKYNSTKIYDSYENLVQDKDIDVIYIATPNTLHKEHILLCLNNNKAVLCEKPLTINAIEAEEIIKTAREKKLFLMEAMWSRFSPIMDKVRRWINEGVLGEIRMVKADFGFRREGPPEERKVSPSRGGGALLDVGVYPISFASMVLKKSPKNITGITSFLDTGVDEQSSMLLGYDKGEMAVLSCAINTPIPKEATIIGNKGFIHIPEFNMAKKATLSIVGKEPMTVEIPIKGNGYNYEAEEVINCLRNGKIESEIMPLDESLSIIKVMDELRRQWGLRYPTEG